MRVVIDLDGTICPIRKENQGYEDLEPFAGAVQRMKLLKEEGHYIIIQTARNMKTQESNLGKVLKNVGKITLDWLDRHRVPYDEIYFGKPNGHLYIDDRALRFSSWDKLTEEYLLALAKEK